MDLQKEEPIPTQLREMRQRLAVELLERAEIWDRATATEEEVRAAFERELPQGRAPVLTSRTRRRTPRPPGRARRRRRLRGTGAGALGGPVRAPRRAGGGPARVDLARDIAEAAFDARAGRASRSGAQRHRLVVICASNRFSRAEPGRFPEVESTLRDLVRKRKAIALQRGARRGVRKRHPVIVDTAAVTAIGHQRRSGRPSDAHGSTHPAGDRRQSTAATRSTPRATAGACSCAGAASATRRPPKRRRRSSSTA